MKKIWFGVGIVVLLLALAIALPAVAKGPPPGCNGTVKTHDGDGEPSPIEEDHPKVCDFHLHGFNFDPGSTVNWHIDKHPGGGEVLSGSPTVDGNGEIRTGLLSLPNGMYKLYWHQEECPGGDKHKVFKVECPVCEEFDTHYGKWSDWSDWSKCVNGEQKRTRTREVWTTDKNDPSVECDRWTEKETQTQWCNLCEEVDTHYGDWGPWSEWSKCADGKKSRTRSREVWETDVNHPEVECDRWTETETQTIDCDLCVEVDTHYGEWSDWSEWSACINSEQTRTRTREVWETDVNHPEVECDRWTETETQTRDCEEPEPICWDKCKKKGDCPEGLTCIGGHCVNAKCPEQKDCICPLPPAGCNEVCEVDANCKEGLICYYGRCREPICPEVKNCECPPCPNAELFKKVTQCGAPVAGVCVRLLSSRGDEIPSPDKDPICTDLTGIAYFSRCLGITPRDNKTWLVEVNGEEVDYFKVPECEMTITLDNVLPCPEPTPPPPPEVEVLPVTGAGPPLATQATRSGPNSVSLIGLAFIAIGADLRRRS